MNLQDIINNEDFKNQIAAYIKYETLGREYLQCDQFKQAEYCKEKMNKCFDALQSITKSTPQGCYVLIDIYSETFRADIERQVLQLNTKYIDKACA